MTRVQEIEEHNRLQRQYYENTSKRTMLPAKSPYLRRHIEKVVRFGKFHPHERVLDIGCGMGKFTLLLAEQGVKVEGLDLSPYLLEKFKEFNAGRHDIPLYCGDILDPPMELYQSFHVATCFFTLHHVPDLGLCFQGIRSLLKPGGRLVCLEPNTLNPLYYLQILFTPGMKWKAERGIAQMREKVIFKALRDFGFLNPVIERFGFFPPVIFNRGWGRRLDRIFEGVQLWGSLLPFQLIRAEKPL